MPKEKNKWCTHSWCIYKNHNPNFYLYIEISDGQNVIQHRIKKTITFIIRIIKITISLIRSNAQIPNFRFQTLNLMAVLK